MTFERLVLLGFFVVFIGIALIVIGSIFSSFRGGLEGQIETGGVLLIGPIPIIFGNSKPLILFSIAGAVIMMAVYFIISRGEFI